MSFRQIVGLCALLWLVGFLLVLLLKGRRRCAPEPVRYGKLWVKCGWCGRKLQVGENPRPVDEEISHGICLVCADRLKEEDATERSRP